jgi:uncharacterized membrane protein YjjP (DUF1212 family)
VNPAWPRGGTEPSDARVELLVGFARVGHDAGYPTADLEERVSALAVALGFEDAQVSATPTILDVSLGAVPNQRGYAFRVRPTAVDLDAIARLDELSGPIQQFPLVFIVPGILMLVPGSAGFNSVFQLLVGQTVNGIEAGFNTFVTAMAIAYGLMVSAVVLPRRFTQFIPHPALSGAGE